MSNIKKFPDKKKSEPESSRSDKHKGAVVNIDKKINQAIQLRLKKFVKETQELKIKQKKLDAYHKALSKISSDKKKPKKKPKKKNKTITHKKPILRIT